MSVIFVVILILAVLFDVTNGMNDISGLIAPPVATYALNVRLAQLLATGGIWAGILLSQSQVAHTLAVGIMHPAHNTDILPLVAAALAGAIGWNTISRVLGLPSSTTHALIGALIGATLVEGGVVEWGWAHFVQTRQLSGVLKIVVGLLISPMIGFVSGYLLWWVGRILLAGAAGQAERRLRLSQWGLLVLQAGTYGMNDAQKSIAMLSLAWMGLTSAQQFSVAPWARFIAALALAMGAFVGSSQIFHRLGRGVVRLRTLEATTAQTAQLGVVASTVLFGLPISSTQVLTTALVGSGDARRARQVRWLGTRPILVTWLTTIPGAAILGAVLGAVFLVLNRGLP